jgi:hypothetical protein
LTSAARALHIYLAERPNEAGDTLAASAQVNMMIATAISVDPDWFWRPVRERLERGEIR